MVRVDVAVAATASVGEGPAWLAPRSRLLWVDIPKGQVNVSDPDTGVTLTSSLPCSVGAAVPGPAEEIVVACEDGFGILEAGTFTLKAGWRAPGERMNDAKCDAAGRLWAGSTAVDYAPGRGALHVVTATWQHRVVARDFVLPNGLGWSPDSSLFYLADSMRRRVYAYDFDLDKGVLGARRTFFSLATDDGLPDGLTVDAEGCVWLAIWGGGRVIRISPGGKLLSTLELPVRQPASCAFGGESWDVLYVTSARDGLDLAPDAVDGSVFAVTGLGVTGLPVTPFGGATR